MVVFFFKQKTAYELRISDWSSDVCSSDLGRAAPGAHRLRPHDRRWRGRVGGAWRRPGGPAQADAERLRPQEDAREGRLMANRVTFKGLSGLQADLDAVAADLTSGMPKAEEAVAESLAKMFRADAPVDTGDRSE